MGGSLGPAPTSTLPISVGSTTSLWFRRRLVRHSQKRRHPMLRSSEPANDEYCEYPFWGGSCAGFALGRAVEQSPAGHTRRFRARPSSSAPSIEGRHARSAIRPGSVGSLRSLRIRTTRMNDLLAAQPVHRGLPLRHFPKSVLGSSPSPSAVGARALAPAESSGPFEFPRALGLACVERPLSRSLAPVLAASVTYFHPASTT